MNILAVTCFTGGSDLAGMTYDMVWDLVKCFEASGIKWNISVHGQGTECRLALAPELVQCTYSPKNIGFAYGMNRAIEEGLKEITPDYILCMNNDLVLNQEDWLDQLLSSAQGNKISSPVTDAAAHHVSAGPRDADPVDLDELSAYCWLVPFGFCALLKKKHGFWLFDEDFAPAYGEDCWTSYLLTKEIGVKIFRLVRRSFVKHLKAKTSSVVPHDRKKTSKILADKFREELKDADLRPDLKAWANRYLKILKC